jgi:hypothetical protein
MTVCSDVKYQIPLTILSQNNPKSSLQGIIQIYRRFVVRLWQFPREYEVGDRVVGWKNWIKQLKKRYWKIWHALQSFSRTERGKPMKSSVRIISVPSEIRNYHFPNTSQKCHLFRQFSW